MTQCDECARDHDEAPRLLLLGGTSEARALSERLARETDVEAVVSLAGRTRSPLASPLPTRVGGFGGVEGLRRYLVEHRIDRVIDATHPFAERISANAREACAALGIPLAVLAREPWQRAAGRPLDRGPRHGRRRRGARLHRRAGSFSPSGGSRSRFSARRRSTTISSAASSRRCQRSFRRPRAHPRARTLRLRRRVAAHARRRRSTCWSRRTAAEL